MTESQRIPSAASRRGRESIFVAVLSNWLWYAIVLVSGFIVPRLIHECQGSELLGIWDLGWALVTYFDWLALGVGSAVSRYVARFRAVEDWDGLNAHFNSCLALLLASFALGVLSIAGFWHLMPFVLHSSGPDAVATARWVILLLGLSGSLNLPGNAFNGVITGYSRFDVLNLIRGTRDIALLGVMVAILLGSGGVVALAGVELAAQVAGHAARIVSAYRLCPELRCSVRYWRGPVVKEVLRFGGKTLAGSVASTSLYQLNSLLMAYFLGPAALAVYARQRALVMQGLRFIRQYAQVFIPVSSHLDARNDTSALRQLFLDSSRYTLYVVVPMTVVFLVMGGPLVKVWMGSAYEAPLVLAILAVGHLVAGTQSSVYYMLLGMGQHGRPAIYELATTAAGVLLALVLLGPLQCGLIGSAVSVAVPIALGRGLLLNWYACRLFGLPLGRYFLEVSRGPVLAAMPLAICLLGARWAFPERSFPALGLGLGGGGTVTAWVYWHWVVPPHLRSRIRRQIVARFDWNAVPSAGRTPPSSGRA
jgi:O-antigen/teichoic acid export membrane protein